VSSVLAGGDHMEVLGSKVDKFGESGDSFSRQWDHFAATPIQISPIFSWPSDGLKMVRWIAARWLVIGENSILLIFASISFYWFQPTFEEAKTLDLKWISEIYLRNFLLLLFVAGSLHLYFYTFRGQGYYLQYDRRPFKLRSRAFTFNNQVHDNIFWSLSSGVAVWSAYEVLIFWSMSNGYAPHLEWSDSPIWFIALFFLTPIWISFHFYWVHRWMHWPWLYRFVHALHHRNTNVGPWSGLSMHPVEHFFFFSSILIHIFIASHPLHILFHMQHQALTAATSHTGFEAISAKKFFGLALGTFHHQIHHRYFECNYGNLEFPLDKWFCSFHDGTSLSHNAMAGRIKQRHKK
jgi:sterol desaturase/sphingolipid hydroxylase (fatty acid hydroxylase superfamily)